ncbi:MAG: hypothetical protein NT178_18470 [Proteobacteria bacterium]|nr:hypothetical protein [Pseudomonadota bacterium]
MKQTDQTINVLILDDDLSPSDRSALEAMFKELSDEIARNCRLDFAQTWNARALQPRGLELFCRNRYDLIVLDLVFKGQRDQGVHIYEAIRSGLQGYRLEGQPATLPGVPILIFSELRADDHDLPDAQDFLSEINASPIYSNSYTLSKNSLRKGYTDSIKKTLKSVWSAVDLIMHVLIPSDDGTEMSFAFTRAGEPDPSPEEYVRRPRHSYRLIQWALDPDKPRGKTDWSCEVISTDQDNVQSCRDLNRLFTEKTNHAMLIHQHPSRDPGKKIIDGVSEIHLHLRVPEVFDLSTDTVCLSNRQEDTKQMFLRSGFWSRRI